MKLLICDHHTWWPASISFGLCECCDELCSADLEMNGFLCVVVCFVPHAHGVLENSTLSYICIQMCIGRIQRAALLFVFCVVLCAVLCFALCSVHVLCCVVLCCGMLACPFELWYVLCCVVFSAVMCYAVLCHACMPFGVVMCVMFCVVLCLALCCVVLCSAHVLLFCVVFHVVLCRAVPCCAVLCCVSTLYCATKPFV